MNKTTMYLFLAIAFFGLSPLHAMQNGRQQSTRTWIQRNPILTLLGVLAIFNAHNVLHTINQENSSAREVCTFNVMNSEGAYSDRETLVGTAALCNKWRLLPDHIEVFESNEKFEFEEKNVDSIKKAIEDMIAEYEKPL